MHVLDAFAKSAKNDY